MAIVMEKTREKDEEIDSRRTSQTGQARRRAFHGPRLTDPIGFSNRLRSVVGLVVVSVILGLLVAAILAAVVAGIVVAIQNALNA